MKTLAVILTLALATTALSSCSGFSPWGGYRQGG